MATLIGIAGLAGAGKDTLASALSTHLRLDHGKQVTEYSFAGPIRAIADQLGLPIFERAHKEVEKTIRFEHFELSLAEAISDKLTGLADEDDIAELYAHFATILRNDGYVVAKRQDVLTISPRRFCQLLGTEAGHAVRRSLWIELVQNYAKGLGSCFDYILVPDTRYLLEAEACDVILGITRPGIELVEEHSSEKEVPEIVDRADYLVRNIHGFRELGWEAQAIADALVNGDKQ